MSIKENISRKLANVLNGRCIRDLSTNLQRMLFVLFPESTTSDLITCKVKTSSKINLIIECNGKRKNVAILNKRFSKRERIYDFLSFLKSIGISSGVVASILSYHYTFGNEEVSGDELAIVYKRQIKKVEDEFNDREKLRKVVEYIFIDDNTPYTIDYFYFGNERIGELFEREKFINMILEHRDNYIHKFMRIGMFNISPVSRFVHRNDVLKNTCILRLNLDAIIKK